MKRKKKKLYTSVKWGNGSVPQKDQYSPCIAAPGFSQNLNNLKQNIKLSFYKRKTVLSLRGLTKTLTTNQTTIKSNNNNKNTPQEF